MTIGIAITTYRNENGTTKDLLIRALDSIKNQEYQDYKVYLIGDRYDDDFELNQIAESIIPIEKIYCENLEYAVERDKYLGINDDALWNCGGCNARNYANEIAKSEVDYVCQLDHDDYYLPNHLMNIYNTINNHPNAAFIHTMANYIDTCVLPNINSDSLIIERLPEPMGLVHSSVCINNKLIPLKYRDVFEEDGHIYPSDADMWRRISNLCVNCGLNSYLVCQVSCIHELERGKKIV